MSGWLRFRIIEREAYPYKAHVPKKNAWIRSIPNYDGPKYQNAPVLSNGRLLLLRNLQLCIYERRTAKWTATDSVKERLSGITDLKHELESTDSPQHLNEGPFVDLKVSFKVRGDEISASIWIPQEKWCARTMLRVKPTPIGFHRSPSLLPL